MGIRPINIHMSIITAQHSKSLEPDQNIKNIQQLQAMTAQNNKAKESVLRILDSQNNTSEMDVLKQGLPNNKGSTQFSFSHDKKSQNKNNDSQEQSKNNNNQAGNSIDIIT